MNDDILKSLKLNLEQIEEKKQRDKEKDLEIRNRNNQKIYYKIWKQILKNIHKKQNFNILFKEGNFIHLIEVDEFLRSFVICKKLDLDKLRYIFIKDGLSCGQTKYGLSLYVTLDDLKKIEANTEISKQKILK